ncbi:bacterial regulatory helix-turn-helix s, AraC family protein [Janthinobacterium agaricidamnosum NBRC 102515 = DSM 9628]|uniref:Bacterial regulatory helix-turn-helix s, AraC family protein n=1 Tax=Janthinobacterium agaricidamnosum NBRC 102515 = DSM 9628 TaxID=1349767 RepID=W0V0W8_9BURK|nr:bacterial regulatory helix-turn-helix s, AraC family protein [Janthinobacterium agaricidamnosum NBRC 102515 = DSM 9628]
MDIGIVVYDGFQALGLALGTVFEYANLLSGKPVYHVTLVSEQGGPVRSSQGFEVHTAAFPERQFDTLIVLGNNDCIGPSTGLQAFLQQAPDHSRRVAAVCTGAFVLAAAGLLDGRRATTHWDYTRRLGKAYPKITLDDDRIFVIDGQIWTSAGMSAGLDLALALVEQDLGPEISKTIARKLVIYHRRTGGQSQFSALLDIGAKSDRVQTALTFARENLKSALSVDVLAAVARLSPRQFSRVFREETGSSPASAVERLRVEAARVLMETSSHSIDIIARETGFGNRERMRQAFLRACGQPPQVIKRLSKEA